ncbi:MAG TPA: glycerol-3-phosphate dehydrogenase/oxidase [Anaerolineaceae bacterium]|nr:glycerol-3-phosphate dehydrogenase/oxidase [Anaerolineaceae bacterium]HUM62651.1 glycerol-3-phosphate dehydrogenase/oxidase [Anaerolineaceae bacterium]
MWEKGWRQRAWQELDGKWDILIIGGGITGAGILRRAVQEGYRTLLVESGDFSSGTSSRSSKLIHGGFRYLRNKQFRVTRESVREREWLLKEARHLVTPLGFLMPCPDDRKLTSQFAVGVILYDLLAPKWHHSRLNSHDMLDRCPALDADQLHCGFLYYDAGMDDACMVLRLIRESVSAGGCAINYARAAALLKETNGRVCGAVIKDTATGGFQEKEVLARVVINATGPWSDEVRAGVNAPARLRKLRGSHLVFSRQRLNLPYAVTLLHPRDRRAMFAIPWEGVSLIGTTDLDHTLPLSQGEPYTTQEEIDYILEAANATFPGLQLDRADIISTFSGLRPVVNTGQADPSKESRAHVVWEENGLVTITGGKYTTFRIMAEDALRAAMPALPHPANLLRPKSYFSPLPTRSSPQGMAAETWLYLLGRYGNETIQLFENAEEGENQPVGSLPNLWSEVRWAARCGAVEHLDDLLLRRVRLGLLLPHGAQEEMARVREIVQPELGWDDARWQAEFTRYVELYKKAYSPSPAGF